MNINEINENLDIELSYFINESFGDIIKQAWSKVKGKTNQVLIKKIANSFFKKHPELLKQVQEMFEQRKPTQESIDLNEDIKKGILAVAITLALLSGIVKPLAAADKVTSHGTGGAMTQYVTNLRSLATDLDDKTQLMGALVGSYAIAPDGTPIKIDDKDKAYELISNLDGGSARAILILSDSEMKGTSGLEGQKDMEQFAKAKSNISLGT